MKRLRPETDAGDAVIGQDGDLVGVERVGVGLDAPFAVGLQRQPAPDGVQQPCQLRRRQMSRRAAADEQRPNRLRFAERRHLGVEGIEVQFDVMVLAGGDGEIAIAAVVGAERNVDVGGARPDPRRCFIHDGVSPPPSVPLRHGPCTIADAHQDPLWLAPACCYDAPGRTEPAIMDEWRGRNLKWRRNRGWAVAWTLCLARPKATRRRPTARRRCRWTSSSKAPSSRARASTTTSCRRCSASIKSHGVLQPLVVRQVGDRFQLVAGERRLRAARAAGLASVPVTVVDFNDQKAHRGGPDREHPAGRPEPDREGARASRTTSTATR